MTYMVSQVLDARQTIEELENTIKALALDTIATCQDAEFATLS